MKRSREEEDQEPTDGQDEGCDVNRNDDHRQQVQKADVQDKIASHYNQIEERGRSARQRSQIFQLKNFNNWLKSSLISRFVIEGDSVLDLACGKGGDLQKFAAHRVKHIVMVDNASKSVHDALQRYNQLNRPSFSAAFCVADCWRVRLSDHLPATLSFHVVSCQFALHYSFESESQARRMFENVTDRLRPGGYFIGTIPDADYILKRLRSMPTDTSQFGNSCYSVRIRERFPWTKDEPASNQVPEFGAEYIFTLQEAVTDCPEWLVQMATLKRLAAEYGLELIESLPFHQYYKARSQKSSHRDLLSRFRCIDADRAIPSEQWEALGIYRTFVFKRPRKTENDKITFDWSAKFECPRPALAKVEDIKDLSQREIEK